MYNRKLLATLGVLIVIWSDGTISQTSRSRQSPEEKERRNQQDFLQPTVFPPMDAKIDEAAYTVGPGDRFLVSIWSDPPQAHNLIVSPEGTLIIPMVGDIVVSGMRLREVKRHILAEVGRKILVGEPTITLVAPREVVVQVVGSPVNEGTYEAYSTDRVQTLLSRTQLRKSTPSQDSYHPERWEVVPILKRSITIRRNSGELLTADLEKFSLTRESRWSPYLQEGDEIVFLTPDARTEYITVGGAVRLPGQFEFKQGDSLSDAIGFAKGLRDDANPDSVLLLRGGQPGQYLDVSDLHSISPEFQLLQAGDRIVATSVRTPRHEQIVYLGGEVRQPGVYPIVEGKTRLSEVIALAGGVTNGAMLHAAGLYREGIVADDRMFARLNASRGNPFLEDTAYVRLEYELRMLGERVPADFAAALQNPTSGENVLLRRNDKIFIPRRTGTVYVFGQVLYPGHVSFDESSTVGAYVAAAGGVTEFARESDVAIIKRASGQWVSPEESRIEEGDLVWVPKRVDRGLAYELSLYATIASIVSATSTLVLVIMQLSRN